MEETVDIQKRFGAALQLVRKNNALTQEEFSIVSSRTYISSLERGMKSPTLEKIDEISEVLGIHPMTLIALTYADRSNAGIKELCNRVIKEASAFIK